MSDKPSYSDVPPHLRGAITPERWIGLCKEEETVHIHKPRPYYCGECEVIHRDSTYCKA